jgi:hypothetical protein
LAPLASAAATGVPAALRAHPVVPRAGGLDSATLSACVGGAGATQRSASFSAAMQAVPGTSTMSVSFNLYERSGAASPYVAVSDPGFGIWQTSNRGISSFTANVNVDSLPAPAAFRAEVHYRWLDRHGNVIRRDDRVTPACVTSAAVAPEPDLFAVRITRSAGSPSSALYGVVVRNSGTAAAGPFAVALSVGSTALADQTIPGLAPASSATAQFTGPRCTAGETITAEVDPTGAVTEAANAQRTITLTCGGGANAGGSGSAG